MTMKLPKKITPCPILEAVVELRFSTSLFSEAIFGLMYDKVKDDYKKFEKLPILQLPEAVRENDPNLKYQPHYKLMSDDYMLQIGTHVISLVHPMNSQKIYKGWGEFSKEAKTVFQKAYKLGVLGTVERLGVRYINFFDGDVFGDLTCSFEGPFKAKNRMMGVELQEGPFKVVLQIASNANVQRAGETGIRMGSVLDIDVQYAKKIAIDTKGDLTKIMTEGHELAKKTFFSLLKEEYLKSLEPVY